MKLKKVDLKFDRPDLKMAEPLFRARTNEGYIIKVLSELLHNNIKVGCFEIDKNGI